MNTGILFSLRRRMTVLAIAALIALSAIYTPMLLDAAVGTSMVNSAAACSGQAGGC